MTSLAAILFALLAVASLVSSSHHDSNWESQGMGLDKEGFLDFMDASREKVKEFADQQELLAHLLKESSYNVGASDVDEGLAILNNCLLDDVDKFLMGMLTSLWNGSQIGIDQVSQHLQPCGQLVSYVLDTPTVTLDKMEAAKHFANDLKCMAMLAREVFWYSKLDGPLEGVDLLEAVVHTLTHVIRLHRAAVELDWAAHAAFAEGKNKMAGSGIGNHHAQQSADPLIGTNNGPGSNDIPARRKLSDKDEYLTRIVSNLMTSLSKKRSQRSRPRRSSSKRSIQRSYSQEKHLDSDVLREIVGNIRKALSISENRGSSSELGRSRAAYSQRSSADEYSNTLAKKNDLKKLLGRLLSRGSMPDPNAQIATLPTTTAGTTSPTTTSPTTYSTTTMEPVRVLQRDIMNLQEIVAYLQQTIEANDLDKVDKILRGGVFENLVGDIYGLLLDTKDGIRLTLIDHWDGPVKRKPLEENYFWK